MQKVSKYNERADECRVLAARAIDPKQKAILCQMAETWEDMARARETNIARKRRLAALDATARVKPQR